MKKALGIGGFPLELTLNRIGKKEVPAVPFNETVVGRFNEEMKIFVTPNQYFKANSEEYLQERKFNSLPVQNQRDGSLGRT